MRILYRAKMFLLILFLSQMVYGQELLRGRVYAYGGGHFNDYVIFSESGEFSLVRSDKGPQEALDGGKGIKGRFSRSANKLDFVVEGSDLPALIPIRGTVNEDGTLRITHRHNGFGKELTRVYHLLKPTN